MAPTMHWRIKKLSLQIGQTLVQVNRTGKQKKKPKGGGGKGIILPVPLLVDLLEVDAASKDAAAPN